MNLAAINFNYWILQSIAMGFTALFIPKLRITGIFGPVLMVVALALVNAHIWDAALFFQIPNHFSAHTLTLLAANALIFWILVKLLPGIEIDGVLAALVAPIVFTVCSVLIDQWGSKIDFIGLAKQGVAVVSEGKDKLLEKNAEERDGAVPADR